MDELKAAHQATWAAGDYATIADRYVLDIGEDAAERAGIAAGEEVLDVATGSGNAAIAAARRGANVVGLDLVPELLAAAAANAERAGVSAEWVAGDAEELPFEDARFDRVVSVLGIQFAPHHEATARELARVCRPGGTITLCNWTPESFPGRMLKAVSGYMPAPPEGASPPPLWGVEDHVTELFEGLGVELDFGRGEVTFRSESPEELVGIFSTEYGPLVKARERLADRWPELEADMLDVVRDMNAADDGVAAAGPYLVVSGTRL